MNEMTDVFCQYVVLDAHTVIFRISLITNPHLNNREVIERCMAGFMQIYPRVQGYEAVSRGGNLDITVYGELNLTDRYEYYD